MQHHLITSSLSVGPVAKATDVLQPRRLIVLTLSPPQPVWTFPCLPPGASMSTTMQATLVAKGGTVRASNGLYFCLKVQLPRHFRGSFTCHKSMTLDQRLYFPSEDFFTLKNPDGFGQVWTCELEYLKQHATSRLPKPLTIHLITI